jgi:ATP-dependent helicase/nuclease subunit A
MSKISWTKEQLQAINCQIGNTIVSAGAGSGKTAVLTERIFKHLCNGIDIDHLLVVTFTKAAADSMKEKTREKIMNNAGGLLEEDRRKKQLNKIDGSYIMTFDAYALSLVKKYHYQLNVSKNINIIDDNVMKLKQEEILEEIINQKYSSKKADFLGTIDDLCVKNDAAFKEAIISINNKMDLIIDRKSFIDNYFGHFFSSEFIKEQFIEYRSATLEILKNISIWLQALENIIYGYQSKFIVEEIPRLHRLVSCETVEELKKEISNFELGAMRISDIDEDTKQRASSFKKKISDAIKEIKEIFTLTEKEAEQQVQSTKKYVKVILEIISQLNEKVSNFKKEKDLYTYSDIARMSIQLVKENENIRTEIRDFYKEILVDEYQDNSDLQEEFIGLISKDNVFVVGDIKQSIYGFRNANPLNFKNKYEMFKNGNSGRIIDLNKNFRSREEVLKTVNHIFSHLMDQYIGQVNYDSTQKLDFGMEKYRSHCPDEKYYQTEIISYKLKEEKEVKDSKGKVEFKKYDVYPFADKDYLKEEVEAMIIAEDIKNKVKSGYQVFDDGKLRNVNYGDFCIMTQTKKHFDLFNEILSSKEIPVKVEREVQISDTDIIKVIKRIFMLIDNIAGKNDIEVKKHCYASIERSFLIQNNDEAIYKTIHQNKIEEADSYLKCLKISQGIKEKTILEVFNEIIRQFDFYEKIHLIGEVEMNVAIIEYVGSLAVQLGQIGYSYSDFAIHLERILSDENKKMEFKLNQFEKNAVRIMSIHNSKGLEFKICYYPLLFGRFNNADIKGDYLFSKERGIILPCKIYKGRQYYGLGETILKKLFRQDKNREMISERIRLFYVALTRAREKIIMVCPLDGDGAQLYNDVVENDTRLKYNSFLSMLNSISYLLKEYVKEINLREDIQLNKNYLNRKVDVFKELEKADTLIKVIDSKEIVPKLLEKERYSKEISIISQKEKDVMEYGTRLHYIMEVIDFNNPDYSIAGDEFKAEVKNFIESDLMKDIDSARVIREFEFIYQQDNLQKHGFIDLLLEYENRIVIIDYKLKNIADENYDLQLLGYKKYIESVSEKKVECYLYSLRNSTYRQVN